MSLSIEPRDDGRVETWWLDRPAARNSITLSMWAELAAAAERVRANRHVRVVVVRGRGEHFSAGADIVGLGRDLAADHAPSNYRTVNATAERAVATLPLPVIAAIDGYCVGGGVQLALACDLRLATPAARFAVTPAKLGIAYPAGSIRRLVAVVGPAAAAELLLTAEQIDAPRALALSLVNRIVDDLDAGLDQLVDSLLSRSAFTQAASKAVIDRLVEDEPLSELGRVLERASLRSGDLDEGLAAFVAKRPPRFAGRPENLGTDAGAPGDWMGS